MMQHGIHSALTKSSSNGSSHTAAVAYHGYEHLVKQVQANLIREDKLVELFEASVWLLFDDIQLAKVCVHSYPYWPCPFMIVGLRYERHARLRKGVMAVADS